MVINYSGDPCRADANPYNTWLDTWPDYEVLTIDVAREDMVLYFPGTLSTLVKMDYVMGDPDNLPPPPQIASNGTGGGSSRALFVGNIRTQANAQKMLESINTAIINKDKIRADLGAMQNRLENTVSNLQIQAENMQAAESRISDADVAKEMADFVRNQILTQASAAMLAQANSLTKMALTVIQGG